MQEDIAQLLRKTRFSKHEYGGVRLFHNQSEKMRQQVSLSFTAPTPNVRETQEKKLLLDLYLNAISRGTRKHPSVDSIIRAVRSSRTENPGAAVSHTPNRLILTMYLVLAPGKAGKTSLRTASDIIIELFTDSLLNARGGERLFEQARAEELKEIDDDNSKHVKQASEEFERRFYKNTRALDIGDMANIIRNARMSQVRNLFEGFISSSYPTIIHSGELSPDTVWQGLEGVVSALRPRGDQASVRETPIDLMSAPGPRYHKQGPSEQMIFLRGYPLRKIPKTHEERYRLGVFNSVLGGGFGGELNTVMREKHSLVYSISSHDYRYLNAILLKTQHEAKHFSRIERISGDVVRYVVAGEFSDRTFKTAKKKVMDSYILKRRSDLACNSPEYRVEAAFKREVLAIDLEDPEVAYAKIGGLDKESVISTAQEFIDPDSSQILTYWKGGAR